jgi:hypothetical protein
MDGVPVDGEWARRGSTIVIFDAFDGDGLARDDTQEFLEWSVSPPGPPPRPGRAGRFYNHSATPPVRPPQDAVAPSGKQVRDRGLEGRRPDDPRPGMQRPRDRIFPLTDKNLKSMLEGRAPRGTDGKKVQLHHRGQFANYRLDEYTATEHATLGLHEPDRDSDIDRKLFDEQRARYWVTRARQLLGIQ